MSQKTKEQIKTEYEKAKADIAKLWNTYTPANIRSKYLIPHISWLKNKLMDMEKNAATLSKAELKKLDTIRKQTAECEEYDLLLKDFADKQISFDLDDGVTSNYALFEGVVAPIK